MIKSYSICPQAAGKIHILPLLEPKEYLDRDRWGNLYICLCNGNFYLFDLTTPNNVRITSIVNHILQDKDGNLWFSTNGQGLFRYNLSKTIWNNEFTSAFRIVANNNGRQWQPNMGSHQQGESGVYKLNKQKINSEPFGLLYNAGNHHSQALAMLEDSEQTFGWEHGSGLQNR